MTEELLGQEEVNHGECFAPLVIGWDDDIHQTCHIVGITKGHYRNADLNGFPDNLQVTDRVSYDDNIRFCIAWKQRVCQSSRNISADDRGCTYGICKSACRVLAVLT